MKAPSTIRRSNRTNPPLPTARKHSKMAQANSRGLLVFCAGSESCAAMVLGRRVQRVSDCPTVVATMKSGRKAGPSVAT